MFGWGLKYKLSLYDPPHAVSHEIPQAKLLSKDEQSLTAESRADRTLSTPQAVVQAAFSGLFFVLLLAPAAPRGLVLNGKYSHSDQPVRPLNFASLSAFFSRPPPVLA